MRRDISNMSMFAENTPIYVTPVVDPEYVLVDDDFQRILREIYSVDELTGLPKGDLAYYLSADGNPQVKAWLEANLLKPRAVKQGTSIEGVTDDMLAEFAQGRDESPFAYRERLTGIYNDAVAEIEKFKNENHE